jgi:oligopeptide/dipeptide ABC transporter ATP-binding protein
VSTPLLHVEELCVEISTRAGVVRAVDGISLEVDEGRALGLVGESGCGKSTALRAILGLLPEGARIVSGQVLFDGRDVTARGSRRASRRRSRSAPISMIFQEPTAALNPVMRVGAQIAEAVRRNEACTHVEARARSIELLRRVGIPEPERRSRAFPHQLSGGMRQRVVIAIALACRPRVLLCDEPTTALDVSIQDQVLALLRELQLEQGFAVLYVSHDLAVVSTVCDHLAVMYGGRIVETGGIPETFRRPRHPYTAGLLGAIPDFDEVRTLSAIPGTPPSLISPPVGCRFQPRCPYAQEDCFSGSFPLIPSGEGGSTACIHPDVLDGVDTS